MNTENAIEVVVENLKQEAIERTAMGMREGMAWQEIDNVVIEVFADFPKIEYVVKVEDKVFYATNRNVFVVALGYILQ